MYNIVYLYFNDYNIVIIEVYPKTTMLFLIVHISCYVINYFLLLEKIKLIKVITPKVLDSKYYVR